MPHIEIKTTQKLSEARKTDLAEKLVKAFAESSNPAVAANIQFIIEDNMYIHFRGDSTKPSANIQLHPGPLTPKEDYEKIIQSFFPVLVKELDTPQNRIYITVSEIKYWGFDGELVKVDTN